MLITLLLILLPYSNAKESWFCTTQDSQVIGNVVEACGRSKAPTEDEARANSFELARQEFLRVCQASDDCRGHESMAEPKRTTCEPSGELIECTRMIAFHVGVQTQKPSYKSNAVQTMKVRKGMTKEELYQVMGGIPRSVNDVMGNPNGKIMIFESKICKDFYAGNICSVQLDHGKVRSYYDVKPEYTDDI